MVIDSAVWAWNINVTHTHRHTDTIQPPRQNVLLQNTLYFLSTLSSASQELSCGWHAARTLVHVVFPTLRPASRDLLARFSDIYLPRSHLRPPVRGFLELSGSYLVWDNKTGWAAIWWRSHDDRLSRLGTIHQRGRHTDSHVATANAASGSQNRLLQYHTARFLIWSRDRFPWL